jgi:ubiquitin C-terminal hydrolase
MSDSENKDQRVSRICKVILFTLLMACIPVGYTLYHRDYYFGGQDGNIIPASDKKNMDQSQKFPRLTNNGTNCFVNSLMQCLFHMDLFKLYVDTKDPDDTNSSVAVIKRIFDRMSSMPVCDFKKEYTELFKIINRHNSISSKFSIRDVGCSFELYLSLIEEFIHYELGAEKFKHYESCAKKEDLDDISNLEISELFLIRHNFDLFRSYCDFFMAIDPPNNLDAESFLNNSIKNESIYDPLPKVLVFQNQHIEKSVPINSFILQEFITVGDSKYKFHAYLHRTVSKDSASSHYYACVYKNDKFHILDDIRPNKVKDPVFNVKLNGIYGIFYVEV